MNKIDKNELYQHLRSFLKSKGVALEEGSYTKRLEKGCNLLTDAINTTQDGVERARGKVGKAVNSLRQSIHEATAPRAAASPGAPPSQPPPAGSAKAKSPKSPARRTTAKRPVRKSA